MRLRNTTVRVLLFAAAFAPGACASLKPPTLRVQGLGLTKVGITGANLRVTFGVRSASTARPRWISAADPTRALRAPCA